MNKRIKELAVQAGAVMDDGNYLLLCEEEIEKFAELIIKECTNVADEETMDDTVGYAILGHFGVEE